MNLDLHIPAAAVTLTALAVFAGCSTVGPLAAVYNTPEPVSTDGETITTTTTTDDINPSDPDPDAVASTESGIAYVTDRPADPADCEVQFSADAIQPLPQPPVDRALVGLYGEFGDRPAPLDGQPGGANNLVQITATTEGACFDPDVSPDGQTLVFASTQHRRTADIYLKSTTGRTMVQITADPAEDLMPSFAPDGEKIAFCSNRDGNWNIYVTSTSGAPAMQLTSDTAPELHPSWSPDGKRLVYCKSSMQSGRWEIWVVDLDTRVHQFLEYGLFPRWNPDPSRNKIVYQRARERGSRLFSVWTIDWVNGEAMHPTEIVSAANAAAMHPAWSPDGTRLVFVTVLNPDATTNPNPLQSDIWVVNSDGTSRTNLTNGRHRNLYPVWSSQGAVYFLSDRSGDDNIWAAATGRTLGPDENGGMGLVNVNPDAQRPSVERP